MQSMDIFQSAYLKINLPGTKDEELLQEERKSYFGGYTCPFRNKLTYGISIDINSSYPASMMNNMPVSGGHFGHELAEDSPPFTGAKDCNAFQDFCLYECLFKFPADELYPSLFIHDEKSGAMLAVLETFTSRLYTW